MFVPSRSVNLLVAASVLGGMAGLYAEKDWIDNPRSRLPDVERPFSDPLDADLLPLLADGPLWH
ncbi:MULTISPECIES: hypothetical protein [Silvimonas]|uniref:hypothetical protein n=1 Tax=Silvimonas TaxID=300264 RepID=UPI0024B33466|nr:MULTISPECIES: hypothetical protein [Silvimonas]MDR3426397.1 hypothetical protein [Silvimonas sp.]